MKIVFRISKMGFGGGEQVFISLAKEFTKIPGVQVIFVTDNNEGKNVKTLKDLGLPLCSLNVSRNVMSFFPMLKFIRNERPDIIISAYTDTNAICILSNYFSNSKTKVIVTEHASLDEHWKSKSVFKRLILKFYVSYIYRLASSVICVSNGLKEQVSKLLDNNITVKTIYNPVRFSKSHASELLLFNKSKPVLNLLAVGRISEQKDYTTLLKALYIVANKQPCSLKIVGGVFCENEFSNLVSIINELGLENIVSFEGYSDNLENYYKNADIFVLSSAWEGFGNVIVEALSFGLPVVSTDCNFGPSEILCSGKYGRLVNVGDHISLANAIIDESVNPRIDRNSLINRSMDFSEETISSLYFDEIKRVVNEKA